MAKTLANLRSDTRTLLDEAVAADWTTGDVDRYINYAYHEVFTSIVSTFEDYYVKTTYIDTVADQQEYDQDDGVPTDLIKVRRIEINYDTSDSNASPKRALPVTLDDIRRDVGNTSLGITLWRNPAYYLYGIGSNSKLGFVPIPDENGTNAIQLWYVYKPSDLSATSDEVDIPYSDRYGRLIAYGAAADLLRKGQQEEQAAAQYRLEFEAGLRKMRAELEDRRADDIRTVTDVGSADIFFDRYHNI